MSREDDLRRAALRAIDKFCEAQGFPVPPLDENEKDGTVWLVGLSPDGRQFGIGYELPR